MKKTLICCLLAIVLVVAFSACISREALSGILPKDEDTVNTTTGGIFEDCPGCQTTEGGSQGTTSPTSGNQPSPPMDTTSNNEDSTSREEESTIPKQEESTPREEESTTPKQEESTSKEENTTQKNPEVETDENGFVWTPWI